MMIKKAETLAVAKFHNVRFYNLAPRSIQCMAYNKTSKKLALSRNDGSIEIWNMQHVPVLEKTIPTTPGSSVEGIAWANERLFSAGLSGEIVEWDLKSLQPRRRQHVTGNAIWCLDVNQQLTELAIGTEEGYINIFDIANDELQYKNLFDKQEGRVLCCKFNASGEFLVTGSMGALRIWQVRTGHALHKMTVARAEKKKEVIVWSLQVLNDFTIISGDSRGIITVWDGRTASEVEWHQVLKADVLALVVNEEQDLLICAGIEPIIRIYTKTLIKSEDMEYYRWVKYLQRNVHEHDVKALVLAGESILSGGIDGYLGVSSASKTTKSRIQKYGPFMQQPAVLAADSRLLLLRYTNYLEVWRLGASNGITALEAPEDPTEEQQSAQATNGKQPHKNMIHTKNERKFLNVDQAPEKLLELRSKNDERIICAALSPDGQFLCYSTQHELRFFRLLSTEEKQLELSRVRQLPKQLNRANQLQFSDDSQRLFVVNNSAAEKQQIIIFSVLDMYCLACIDLSKHIKDHVQFLTLSECASYVIAAGLDRSIAVWHTAGGKPYKHLLNLPRYVAATTAVAMHAKQPRLVASYADGKLIEYDLEEMCFTCADFVPNFRSKAVNSIVLDERNPNVFLLLTDLNFFVLQKQQHAKTDEAEQTKRKTAKKSKVVASVEHNIPGLALKLERFNEHFLHLARLSEHELVAVGVNPILLIEQLPNAFKQKKFGAS